MDPPGGRQPKRQRWKTLGKYLAALVLGGIISLVSAYGVLLLGTPAPPAPIDTPLIVGSTGKGDPGAQSSVTVAPLDDGGALVNGTVTDTKDDQHGVKLELVPIDAEEQPQSPVVVVNNRGAGGRVGLGPGGAETDRQLRGDIRKISIRECVFDRNGQQRLHELGCGSREVNFAKRP